MTPETDKKLRIKIRLRTGEEFEAEGDQAFINEQKGEFLSLISAHTAAPKPLPRAETAPKTPPPTQLFDKPSYTPAADFALPKSLRSAAPAAPQPSLFSAPQEQTPQNTLTTNAAAVWNAAARAEGDIVVLRRKFKLLGPATAALILTAAAKMLLKENSYSALKLAKSMKLSGYMEEGDRLDRLTAPEVKQGTLAFEGTKRNRAYKLSDEGFARAFVLAEKLS